MKRVTEYTLCLNSSTEEQGQLLNDTMKHYGFGSYYFKTKTDNEGRFVVGVYILEEGDKWPD